MSRKSKRQFRRGKHKPPAGGRGPSLRLTQRDVEASANELVAFHRLFELRFQRREQRQWSAWYMYGQLANLARKMIEGMILALKGPDPNAIRGLQQFIGQGRWAAVTPFWMSGCMCPKAGWGRITANVGNGVVSRRTFAFRPNRRWDWR